MLPSPRLSLVESTDFKANHDSISVRRGQEYSFV
jgi:hypothetical protein